MSIKIVTIVGARPQFIKAAAVSRAIRINYRGQIDEIIVHTGQHHDDNMSQVFFDELDIPRPAYNLEIAGGSHGAMTGRMIEAIERVLIKEAPDWVLIYGDTNSTLAGALAAAKLNISIGHVEAGLRSFNMSMPEEVNRILSDRIATLLFCPTLNAVKNLFSEGISTGVHNVGDVMYDVALHYGEAARTKSTILSRLKVKEGSFALATCHRAENTDDTARLREICLGLADTAESFSVILPLHPRTRKLINNDEFMTTCLQKVVIVDPLPFLDMIALEQAARVIITDSGGIQKEAAFFGVPCITMRDETEWVETVELGWNKLVGASRELIASSALSAMAVDTHSSPYGSGKASEQLLSLMIA